MCQGMSRYFPVYEDYVREFFRSSVADGISYIESRMPLWYKCVSCDLAYGECIGSHDHVGI